MSVASAPSAYSTLFLFATALATGTAAVLPWLPLGDLGRRFFVLATLVAVALLGLAVVAGGLGTSLFYLLSAMLLVACNVTVPRQPGIDPGPRGRPAREPGAWARVLAGATLAAGAAAGGAGLVADALAFPARLEIAGPDSLWLAVSFLASSALLGAALVSMVLGHWYLVVRGLPFVHLERLTVLLASTLAGRVVLAGLAALAQAGLWTERLGGVEWNSFLIADGLFLLGRVLFGLLVPLGLVAMVWRCVKLRSNQSATGILYVVVAFVMIGEILAKHLLLAAGILV